MRYPIQLIPALPVAPDFAVGIALTPIAPPAPAAAPVAVSAGEAAPKVVWANVTTATPSNTDPLVLDAPYGPPWDSVPTNQLFYGFGSGGEAQAIAIAQNVPAGAVITWTLDNFTFSGVNHSDLGTAPSISLYLNPPGITILTSAPEGSFYVLRFGNHDSFVGVVISDLTISAYADAVLIGSLSLSLTNS